MNAARSAFPKHCAVCNKGRNRGELCDYRTILLSMGFVGHTHAHTKCILRIQQQALQFKSRLSRGKR